MHIERTIVIAAPPERVWPLLADSDNVKLWNPDVVSDEPLEPGPVRVGTLSRTRIREGKRIVEYESEITALELGARLGLELRGGSLGAAPMRLDYRLREHPQGVELGYESRWQPAELSLKLFAPLLGWLARRNTERALARLRQLAEAA